MSRKYARQAKLLEVGLEGQARIESTVVLLRGAANANALAVEVAARYLAGAGAQWATDSSSASEGTREGDIGTGTVRVSCDPFAARPVPFSEGVDEVARGSFAALLALRAILELGTTEETLRSTSAHTPSHQ